MSAPTPTLKILPVECIYPHEEHDSQRSIPLRTRLEQAEFWTNPPIVAPMGSDEYVILDGANRYHTARDLGFHHILVQVASYDSGMVDLGVWQHVVSHWQRVYLIEHLQTLPDLRIEQGWNVSGIAQILLRDGVALWIDGPRNDLHARNALLRQVVAVYRENAKLDRVALDDPAEVWSLYPDGFALFRFPNYRPSDIFAAAQRKAFLPSGISRHIIQGRALRLNYPMSLLRDTTMSLESKNNHLQKWLLEKVEARAMRYYAESTYQFDE